MLAKKRSKLFWSESVLRRLSSEIIQELNCLVCDLIAAAPPSNIFSWTYHQKVSFSFAVLMFSSYNRRLTSFIICPVVVSGIDYKTTNILLDGRRVKLQLWYCGHHTHFPSLTPSALWIKLVFSPPEWNPAPSQKMQKYALKSDFLKPLSGQKLSGLQRFSTSASVQVL